MTRKKKRHAKLLNDIVKYQAEALAKWGFSHRYIASICFLKSPERVTPEELHCISGYLHRQRILLTDWRQGRSPRAALYARNAIKRKRRKVRLRVARAA